MFILSQNGKVGVYGIGDRVIGSAGTEKALIMDGATNTIVDNTVEEIHLQNNIENLSFAVDENTNTVSIMNGNSVVASFAANETGIKLFTANGMSVIKMSLDDQGNASFTADNGTTGSTPVTLPTNGSALPTEAIDTNAKSENAGGTTPTPSGAENLSVDQYNSLVGTEDMPDAYNLVDTAAKLATAPYTAVTGANSITLEDTVDGLAATSASALSSAIAVTTNVKLSGALQDLLGVTSADFGGKPTSLVVTSSSTKVDLGELKVAEAAGAQAELDAFLARTDVTYKGASKPDKLTINSYSIADTADAIIKANADTTQKGLLTAEECRGVIIEDTVDNIKGVSLGNLSSIKNLSVNVADRLENLTDIATDDALLNILTSAKATYTATDTTSVKLAYDAKLVTTPDSTGDTTAKMEISFDSLAKDSTVTLDASALTGTAGVAVTGKPLDLNTLFSFDPDVQGATVNFTGSNQADFIKAHANGGIIDGGLEADTITLGKGNDIVKIGTGITAASELSANVDTISAFGSEGTDKLDFNGDLLGGFGKDAGISLIASGNGVLKADYVGNIMIVSDAAAASNGTAAVSALFSDNTFKAGDEMILVTKESSAGSLVWYIQAESDGKIDTAAEINLVAIIADNAALTADNFA